MFELLVASRFLRLQKKVRAIFSTVLISVVGISIGVFSLNIVLAVMLGFQTELSKTIIGASPHILVSAYDGSITEHALAAEKIVKVAGVTGVSPVVYGTGLLVSASGSHGTASTGINPSRHRSAFPSLFSQSRGGVSALEKFHPNAPPIVLGYGLAGSLGVEKGDEITFVSSPDKKDALKKRPKMKTFEVAGVFKYGTAHYDSTISYIKLADAFTFFGKPGPSSFEVAVADPMSSELVAREIEDALGFPFVAQSWQEANSKLFSALRLEKLGLTIFLGFMVFVASLSVVSVLLMIMIEKSRDIAILRAAGASRKQVGNIFVIIGAALGFAGTFFGTATALAVCQLLSNNTTVSGLIPFDPDVYGISKFPVMIEPLYFFVIGVSSQLLCVLVSLYPAYCVRSGNLAAKLKV
ncbi:MAG: FtsX-like permease family protein [Candidatus Mycalebacterium zealandia]|nr:MAG: FtsX-like permease family protein [Candidatus Mycalebacterium zealandia]